MSCARENNCNIASVYFRRWFEENVQNDTVRNVVKLLRDLKNRFEGLTVLSPWMIDLLVILLFEIERYPQS